MKERFLEEISISFIEHDDWLMQVIVCPISGKEADRFNFIYIGALTWLLSIIYQFIVSWISWWSKVVLLLPSLHWKIPRFSHRLSRPEEWARFDRDIKAMWMTRLIIASTVEDEYIGQTLKCVKTGEEFTVDANTPHFTFKNGQKLFFCCPHCMKVCVCVCVKFVLVSSTTSQK